MRVFEDVLQMIDNRWADTPPYQYVEREGPALANQKIDDDESYGIEFEVDGAQVKSKLLNTDGHRFRLYFVVRENGAVVDHRVLDSEFVSRNQESLRNDLFSLHPVVCRWLSEWSPQTSGPRNAASATTG